MMKEVTANDVRNAVREHGVKEWVRRSCSVCGTPLRYVFADVAVFYDSNCGCASYWTPMQERSFADVADALNMQTPEIRARMWDELIGSAQCPPPHPVAGSAA